MRGSPVGGRAATRSTAAFPVALRVSALLLALVVIAGCTGAQGADRDGAVDQTDGWFTGDGADDAAGEAAELPEPAQLAVEGVRGNATPILAGDHRAPYNYGPTVLLDDGRYRAWWCSQLPGVGPPGDDVLYAEATEPGGPYAASTGSPAEAVFTGLPGAFDGMHTCDPSVLKVGDSYYLYYTGAAGDHNDGNGVGVAHSSDGITWSRLGDGKPVVSASYDVTRENTYGAGQPAAVFLDDWFYLMFTDTTGAAAGWNGAGQFVLRARDPLFTDGLQMLTEAGFVPATSTEDPRAFSVVDAFSADLMWVDALQSFVIAHQTESGTSLTFWDREFRGSPYERLVVEGPWREGPGLVREGGGHAPVSRDDPCGRVPLDVLRATTATSAPTDIAHYGLDVVAADGCRDARRAASVLNGFAVPAPDRTMDLVLGGERVRIERRSVAEKLAVGILEERVPAVEELPVVAEITAGLPAVHATDQPVGLVADDRLWLVGGQDVAELNGSRITEITPQEWAAHEHVRDLRRAATRPSGRHVGTRGSLPLAGPLTGPRRGDVRSGAGPSPSRAARRHGRIER
ncbi:beta-xylosidase [Actinoalloteichus sp. GBA129-24]|uniref:beta-xylosidase n=1 Tax=Actinoalloteichus sp. GBA129-24 TaxID=1612551 RepID=UPI0009509C4D|nr:beta-xylosidase [Actinoalloteichus sp. GBA129-24]APU20459.1 hypothetical protein UA75_12235 [Actinoalloteichus sp. GBA129-24]